MRGAGFFPAGGLGSKDEFETRPFAGDWGCPNIKTDRSLRQKGLPQQHLACRRTQSSGEYRDTVAKRARICTDALPEVEL